MKINRLLATAKFKLVKFSPEILLAGGIVSIGAGVYLACKATTQLEGVIDKHKEVRDTVETTKSLWDRGEIAKDLYSEKQYKSDLLIVKAGELSAIAKLYAPAAVALAGGVVAILASHNILHKRHVAAVAAYKTLDEFFRKYRSRVIEDAGADKDFEYYTGLKSAKKITDEDGSVTVEVDGPIPPGKDISIYDRWFDEGSTKWQKTAEMNLYVLKAIEQEANAKLDRKGHVFLNEVYDMLGIPRSQAGQMVGWVKEGDGDGYIDFGIFEVLSDYAKSRQEFVNGIERTILLSFNVDGVIVDKI